MNVNKEWNALESNHHFCQHQPSEEHLGKHREGSFVGYLFVSYQPPRLPVIKRIMVSCGNSPQTCRHKECPLVNNAAAFVSATGLKYAGGNIGIGTLIEIVAVLALVPAVLRALHLCELWNCHLLSLRVACRNLTSVIEFLIVTLSSQRQITRKRVPWELLKTILGTFIFGSTIESDSKKAEDKHFRLIR